jgi:DNA ligase D-like protein (predicted ligase)
MTQKASQPNWISPMLATLEKRPFFEKGWIFEKKFDGIRCLVFAKGDTIKMYSRNHKLINNTYPEILTSLATLSAKNYIIDGEIVTEEGKLNSFSKLQTRMHRISPTKKMQLTFFIFDLLYFDNQDLRKLPLEERKKHLKHLLKFNRVARFCSHRSTNGKGFYQQVIKKGFEGVIAKRKDSTYKSKRTRDWLKFKAVNDDDFIIGGFTKPQGSRKGFGALLIGFYQKGKLRYAGKVGTGFSEEMLMFLSKKLEKLTAKESYFSDSIKEKNVTYVKPKLIAKIAFTERTKDKKLRHPSFLGLKI